MLLFGITVAFGEAAPVVRRSREHEDDPAIAVAPRIETELVVRRDALGNVVQIELPIFILVEAQAIAGVEVVDDDDRLFALAEDDGHFIPQRPVGSPVGVEKEHGLLLNLGQVRAEEIRRTLRLVDQVVRKVDLWPALPVDHVAGEHLLKQQAHGHGGLPVIGAGLNKVAHAKVGLQLLDHADEVGVDDNPATEVIMHVAIEPLGVLAEPAPQVIDLGSRQLVGLQFLDLMVDEPVEH